jgi:hypothetical protein
MNDDRRLCLFTGRVLARWTISSLQTARSSSNLLSSSHRFCRQKFSNSSRPPLYLTSNFSNCNNNSIICSNRASTSLPRICLSMKILRMIPLLQLLQLSTLLSVCAIKFLRLTVVCQGGVWGARNLSEWNLSESLFSTKPESFRMESFRKESFRIKSFRRNLSEKNLRPNRNLSEWNLSEGIFKKIFSAKPESFIMESFRVNLSE